MSVRSIAMSTPEPFRPTPIRRTEARLAVFPSRSMCGLPTSSCPLHRVGGDEKLTPIHPLSLWNPMAVMALRISVFPSAPFARIGCHSPFSDRSGTRLNMAVTSPSGVILQRVFTPSAVFTYIWDAIQFVHY